MVKIFGKNRKKESTEKVFANGKIRVRSFRDLEEKYFICEGLTEENIGKQTVLFAKDGAVFLNCENEQAETFARIYEAIIFEPQKTLEEFQKYFKKQNPGIKTFEDLARLDGEDNELIVQATAALLVPTEIQRRKIEKMYYSRK